MATTSIPALLTVLSEKMSSKTALEARDTSQIPENKRAKFPKSARILTSSQYKFFHRNSNRLIGELVSIDFRQGRAPSPKLGLTVSKKFGKAHDRNRFKRVVREAFRELYSKLPENLEINVSPRKSGSPLSKQAILVELQALLTKIVRS
jgi:ribonuclease P protein component